MFLGGSGVSRSHTLDSMMRQFFSSLVSVGDRNPALRRSFCTSFAVGGQRAFGFPSELRNAQATRSRGAIPSSDVQGDQA